MNRAPIKLHIERAGQPYVDKLVEVKPVESRIGREVREIFNRPELRPIVTAYDRIPLRWVTRGKLIPMK